MKERDFYKWLGCRLKELRVEKDIKQPELAERIDISQSYLSRIEGGQKFSTYLLHEILEAMGCSLADLTPEDEDVKKNSLLRSMGTNSNSLVMANA